MNNFFLNKKIVYYVDCSDIDVPIDPIAKNLELVDQEFRWQTTNSYSRGYTIKMNKQPILKGDHKSGLDYKILIEEESTHLKYRFRPLTKEIYKEHVMEKVAFGDKLKGKSTQELQEYFYDTNFD